MRLGLFTDALGDRSLREALAWLAANAPDVRDVEVGTGGYSHAPHADLAMLVADGDARRSWLAEIEGSGFRLAALNVSGNPLETPADDAALRDTLRRAAALGVPRVVCMSGGSAALAGGGWFPGIEEALARYWEEQVLPYWRDVSTLARSTDASLRLCLELEPGAAVFNVTTFERIAVCGDNVAVNLDPSHFFWQGIDPLVVVERLGDRVAFAHGKDTVIDRERVALDGVVDRTTWRFATVGHGHDAAWWRTFAEALSGATAVDVVSIEWEDDLVDPEGSILQAAKLLAGATERVAA